MTPPVNLADQLAAIGLPAPSTVAVLLEHPDPIEAVTTEVHAFLHRRDRMPFEVLEMHATLVALVARTEHELTKSGSKISKEAPSPTVKKRGVVRRWTSATDKLETQEVEYDAKCDHRLVSVDEQQDFLICRGCGCYVSAIWWVSRHTKDIVKAESWRLSIEQDRLKLHTEIEQLKDERSKLKQAIKRAKETIAREAVREDLPEALQPKRRGKRTT